MRSTTFGTESTGYKDWSGYIDAYELLSAATWPARQIDGLDTGLHLLHGLTASQCAQAIDVVLSVQQAPTIFQHHGELMCARWGMSRANAPHLPAE